MPTRLFLGRMYARAFSGCLYLQMPNAWATIAHPTLPKMFCKKQKLNDAVADTREWTRITPVA
nr:hypothetical protein [uncultured Kingella sp.]